MTEKGLTTSIQILSFDAPGEKIAPWLHALSGDLPESLWVLLEQMHRFDFEGPEKKSVIGLLTEETVALYGLRGRLFWDTGQIEWRRLDNAAFRIVAISEDSEIPPMEDIKGEIEPLDLVREEQKLILWGESRKGDPFKERRVAGSQDIPYPESLKKGVQHKQGTLFPTITVCVYRDLYHKSILWRLKNPIICKERELR